MVNIAINYYEVKSPNDTYFIKEEIEYNIFNKKEIEKIKINLDDCVTISISGREQFALLDSIFYRKRCNILQDLTRGTGTRDMLNTALAFVKNNWSNRINSFKLNDLSHLEKENDNIDIFLSQIALTGKTWYERYFNAVYSPRIPTGNLYKKQVDLYYDCLYKMINPAFKLSITTIDFEYHINYRLDDNIVFLYNNSKTFVDFFNILLEFFNKDYEKYNLFIKPWLKKFIEKVIFDNNKDLMYDYYMIDINKLNYDGKIQIIKIPKLPEKNQFGGNPIIRKLLYISNHMDLFHLKN